MIFDDKLRFFRIWTTEFFEAWGESCTLSICVSCSGALRCYQARITLNKFSASCFLEHIGSMNLDCKSNVKASFWLEILRGDFFFLPLPSETVKFLFWRVGFFFFLFTFIQRGSPFGVSNLFRVSPIRHCRFVSSSPMWLSKQQENHGSRGFSFNLPV